jgi:putative oxygen-independent coproporphyrinogen III oxidase
LLDSLPQSKKVTDFAVPSSAYLHIPFCRRRCYYCDFPISVVGDKATGSTSGAIAQYIEILCQEIRTISTPFRALETIFFGGGTPSLLSTQQLGQVLNVLDQQFGIASTCEISMEMDPGTFSIEQLQGYQQAGVNRVSLGVQAFQDELLKICGRSHNKSDIFAAVDAIRQVEVADFSLDLISGLPHQTLEQWQASLEAAVEIAPTHISSYDLVVEPVTAFGRQYQPGSKPLPTDETTAQMYQLAHEILGNAGYEHYEISNYAQPGHQCRHNRVYWENRPYYGFGMGAASYTQGCRFTRPRTRREYYEWVQQLTEASGVVNGAEALSESDVLLETMMLGLRLAAGLSLSALAERFGEQTLFKIGRCLYPYYQQGWVEVVGNSGDLLDWQNSQPLPATGRLRLTAPEGFLFSNTVLSDLFNHLG